MHSRARRAPSPPPGRPTPRRGSSSRTASCTSTRPPCSSSWPRSGRRARRRRCASRSEEHTSELQSQSNLVCRLLLEKKKKDLLVYVLVLHLYTHLLDLALQVHPHHCMLVDH